MVKNIPFPMDSQKKSLNNNANSTKISSERPMKRTAYAWFKIWKRS